MNTNPTTHPPLSMICSSPKTKVTFLSKATDPKGFPMDAGLIHSLTQSNVFALSLKQRMCVMQRSSHFGGFHRATLNNTPHCTLWSIMLGGQVWMIALNNFWGKETKKRTNQCDWLMIPPPSRQMEWQTKNAQRNYQRRRRIREGSVFACCCHDTMNYCSRAFGYWVWHRLITVFGPTLCLKKDDLFHGLHLHTSIPPPNPALFFCA